MLAILRRMRWCPCRLPGWERRRVLRYWPAALISLAALLPFAPSVWFALQPRLAADPILALSCLALETLWLGALACMLWRMHFPALPDAPRAPLRTELLRGGARAGEGPPVSPRTVRAVQRALRNRDFWTLPHDARLPEDEQLVQFRLHADPRPGEYQTWILVPVGPEGAQDPGRARRFWIRVDRLGSEEHPSTWAGTIAGPFRL